MTTKSEASRRADIDAAFGRLAALFESGELMAQTQPVQFLDMCAREIVSLRENLKSAQRDAVAAQTRGMAQMSALACSTCRRWDTSQQPPTRGGEMFGACALAEDSELPPEPNTVMLCYGDSGSATVYTRCDFNCGWWEAKS